MSEKPDYRSTVFLPKTDFPMKAGLANKEPAILARWASEACIAPYRNTGWLGLVPEACNGATLILPRTGGFTLWGWPYRFMARMSGAGARFFIAGDDSTGDHWVGLTQAEQLGDVPHDYPGMLLVEDMDNVGRALVR